MLVLEALVVVLIICGVVAFLNVKRKQKDRAGVNSLIQSIGLTSDQHALQLEDQFAGAEDADPEAVKELIKSAKANEKALYQHIVSLYLKRDANMLSQLGSKVNGVTDTYLSLMDLLSAPSTTPTVDPEELAALKMELDQAITEKRRLSKELRTVTNTLEDVSDEYAQMFGGTPAFDEIKASKARMMRMIEQTIQELSPEDESAEDAPEPAAEP